MSTPTPTGNGHATGSNGHHGNAHAANLGKLTPWLLDEATLTRLARDVLDSFASDSLPGLDTVQAPPRAAHIGQPSYYFITEPEISNAPSSAFGAPGGAFGVPEAAPDLAFDVAAVRADFPMLGERVSGRPLVWLDNAATTQKPRQVIDRIARFYNHENSNIHRGAHTLATRATEAYEDARVKVAEFIGAPSSDRIVFTRGTTESINLVAQAWGRTHVGPGDEIVLSHFEHHANIVPWQQLAGDVGARLRVVPVDDDGRFMLDRYLGLLSGRTRLVTISHVSNVLGTVVPLDQIIAAAHQTGARVLIDGAQAVAHLPVDVRALDADFYAFSGHKVFGPTGIGALYAKPEILADMPPWQSGGNMISEVTFKHTSYQNPPAKFEAGTGSIADAIGLAAALDYVSKLGMASICGYEHQLVDYAMRQMSTVPGIRLLGTTPGKASTLSFVLDGHRTSDIGTALDRHGIAVRSGHHCAQPILRRYGLETAVRPSLAMYNTYAEVDQLVTRLHDFAMSAR